MDQDSILEQIANLCDEINDMWYEVRDLTDDIENDEVRDEIISAYERGDAEAALEAAQDAMEEQS